jgi:hypothetical protein
LLFGLPLARLTEFPGVGAVPRFGAIRFYVSQEFFMNGKWLSIVVLVGIAGLMIGVDSCAHSQQLVSIAIQPATETFGTSSTPVIENAGAQVQLQALGTYIHPPVTKDITSQATWSSNTPLRAEQR